MQIYKANILYTPTPQAFETVNHGYVVVNDGGCVEGVYTSLPEQYAGASVADFGDSLLIPAMNDMHVHAPQYRNMGLAMDLELLPWLNTYTFPEEARFVDTGYAREVYRCFVQDLIRFGTMRSVIFATIHGESSRILADCLNEAGLGALVGVVGMDRNCPDNLRNTPAEAVRDTEALLAHTASMPRVAAIVTPRFVPSCTPEMMSALGDLARAKHLPVQSHLSENRSEIAWVRELEPASGCYGDAYRRYGLFGDTPTLMAHCVYTDGEELDLMACDQVYAVHCPTSNCNLASGIAPVRKLLQHGVPVVLGSDISGGHTLSMFEVLRYVIQMSKMQYAASCGQLAPLTLSEAFYLATKSAGGFFAACGMDRVGSFEKGYAFDALLIEQQHPDTRSALEQFIYTGDDRHITRRFCQGQTIPQLDN